MLRVLYVARAAFCMLHAAHFTLHGCCLTRSSLWITAQLGSARADWKAGVRRAYEETLEHSADLARALGMQQHELENLSQQQARRARRSLRTSAPGPAHVCAGTCARLRRDLRTGDRTVVHRRRTWRRRASGCSRR
jgi:hypothetical protein